MQQIQSEELTSDIGVSKVFTKAETAAICDAVERHLFAHSGRFEEQGHGLDTVVISTNKNEKKPAKSGKAPSCVLMQTGPGNSVFNLFGRVVTANVAATLNRLHVLPIGKVFGQKWKA